MGKLSGPARLLAMSWSKTAFDSVHGVKLFLQRLAASPLVRRTLPNAAAICQQYFSFRRNPHESIGNFLVRETLVHEEFVEAIIRLHEEKIGIAQEDRDFGLPTEEEEWTGGRTWDDWWGEWHDEDADDDPPGEPGPHHEPANDPSGDQGPSVGRRGDDHRAPQGATGSSPSHRDGGSQPAVGPSAIPAAGTSFPTETPMDELSAADSFILEVLRGWRLLQAAGLNAEEKRDILSTTKNSLDFAVISAALQSLWDDQLLGHRSSSSGHSSGYYNVNYMNPVEEDYAYYQEADAWSWQEGDWWYDDYYTSGYDADPWWEEDWDGESMPAITPEPLDPDALAKLQEAQQAEKVAESLAMEANRTWTEAQRATQAIRKDRGFGAVVPGSSQGVKCFLCGGNHFARDCPDRRHPGFKGGKAKGKFRNYYTETDDYYDTYIGKGKGKQKGKHKKGMVLDAQAMWSKGKGKSKNKDPYKTVNAYSLEGHGSSIFVGGLEVSEVMGVSTSSVPETGDSFQGMLDSGATASAAPEAVVKSLIEAVLAQDPGARIDLQAYSRPFFRFGNGKWGRALGKTTISSSLSGSTRQFSLYTLPNPPEYYSSQFDKSTLVPVLIGMDFMGETGEGMIIDFATGMAMSSKESNPEIYKLKSNRKGHLVMDIVYHLTRGHRSDQGRAQVVVHQTAPKQEPIMSQQWLDLGAVWFDMTACDAELDEQCLQQSRDRIWQLYHASRTSSSSTATSAQMTGPCVRVEPPTTTSSRSPGHVVSFDDRGADLREPHSVSDQTQGKGAAPGPGSSCTFRPSRPANSGQSVAMHGAAYSGKGARECARGLAPVCSVQSSNGVCPPQGQSWIDNEVRQPGYDQPDAVAASATHGERQTDCGDLPGDGEEDLRRGVPEFPHHAAARDESALGSYFDEPIADNTAPDYDSNDNQSRQIDRKQLAGGQHGRGGDDCGLPRLRRSRTTVRTSTTPKKSPSLPLYVGKKIMAMGSLLLAMTTSLLVNLHMGQRDGVWEVACSPHSWLSEAAEKQGLRPRRINLANGFDLYKDETWQELRRLRRLHRPRRIWFSLPCTKWCAFTALNFSTPERQEVLETARRRERRMLRNMVSFVKETLLEEQDTDVYYEWPIPCFGWKQAPTQDLAAFMEQQGIPWLDCRIDGCNYGLKDSEGINFLRKRWLVKTTDERFHQVFRAKVCCGQHQHTVIEGQETARSSYYPWRMVEAICRHWRDQLAPSKHHRLLRQRDVYVVDMDDEVVVEPDNMEEHEFPIYDFAHVDEHVIAETFGDSDDGALHGSSPAHQLAFLRSDSVEQLNEEAGRNLRLGQFSFECCENLLLRLRSGDLSASSHSRWKHCRGQTVLLGAYSHGNMSGLTRASYKLATLTRYLNSFLKHHLPQLHWSSIMLSVDNAALPHKDFHNLKNSTNALVCFGNYVGGGLWIQGRGSDQDEHSRRKLPGGQLAEGRVMDAYHKFVLFSPQVYHATQHWKGVRISLAVYTTRLAPSLTESQKGQLRDLGFPKLMMGDGNDQQHANAVNVESPAEPPVPELPEGVTKWKAQVAKNFTGRQATLPTATWPGL